MTVNVERDKPNARKIIKPALMQSSRAGRERVRERVRKKRDREREKERKKEK